MKRLMIVAAVALMAIASQASSFRWSASGVQNFAGTGGYSGTATLYAYLSTESASSAVEVESYSMSSGTISSHVFSWDDAEVGSNYNFYYTMTDADENVFTSGVKTGKAQAKSTTTIPSFGSSGSWAGAPEPTSAMLLLLGVAGLALKRKQK